MENDKYKNYFNDEGEFLISFEQIDTIRNPRKFLMLRRMMLTCVGIATFGVILMTLAHYV